MKAETEDLLVPVFMILDPIPEACLERILNWFATTELRCKYRELHVLCTGCVDVLRPMLTDVSNGTRLC